MSNFPGAERSTVSGSTGGHGFGLAPPADGNLARRVHQFLSSRGVSGQDRLEVEELNVGVLVIRGRVSTPQSKWLCLNCCRRVAGVLRLIDELVIDEDMPI